MIVEEFKYPPFKNAESVVAAFIEKARKFDVEILQAVDDDGRIVCENVGDTHSVQVPEEAKGHWLMHSHATSVAPLSAQDLMVINDHQVKMNMAVCHDGSISWSTGFKRHDRRMTHAVDVFVTSLDVQVMVWEFEAMGGAEVGNGAVNWFLLSFFSQTQPELRDLHIKAGTDDRAYKLSNYVGVEFPPTFSFTAD